MARLETELRIARDRQTATSEILRVISQSPTDVQPVFDAIVLAAVRLLGCDSAFILLCDATTVWPVAEAGPEGPRQIGVGPAPIDPDATFPSRAIIIRKNLHVPDWSAIELPEYERRVRELRGFNSAFYLPLLRDGECIGLLGFASNRTNSFGDSHIALAESFRDQALIAIVNTRQFNETKEALERQTATAEILKVIASSPSDVQPVFEAIAARSKRLVNALSTTVFGIVDGMMHLTAFTPINPEADATLRATFPAPLADFSWGESIRRGEIYRVTDAESESEGLRDLARKRGWRSCLCVPLLRDGKPIGMIGPTRAEPGPFADHDVQLLQTFADQAVIAIENVRLFNETTEALERQTATAEILKVIASSPSDVQPVYDAIVASANRLIGGHSAVVYRFVDGVGHLAAFTPLGPAADAALKATFPQLIADVYFFQSAQAGEVLQVSDTEAHGNEWQKKIARARGFRSVLFAPLISKDASIGVIATNRRNPGPFSAHHVQLLRTFADQAVIAIENVRLFNETQETLERQTATADILKVIASSPSDVQPVFAAIAERSNRLIEGLSTAVYSIVDDTMHLMAFTRSSPEADAALQASFPRPLSEAIWGEQIRKGEIVEIPDANAEWSEVPGLRDLPRLRGFRSLLFVPLLRDGNTIGIISVTRRETGTFAPHHVQLLQTFADQAVIAIGNVRLFDEVQAKTRELTESLEYQIATADVLNVISRSTTNVQPVFDAIANSAARLFAPCETTLTTVHDGQFHWRATASLGRPVEAIERVRAIYPLPFDIENSPSARAIQERRIIEITDAIASDAPDNTRRAASAGAFRSVTFVPLLRDGIGIGTIILTHPEAGFKLSPKQLALVQTFADQAVIAIENARLFDEVQERTRELSASLDDLRAAQDRLIQTEKLASLGQLTAGIAHEIKNPLNFVNNFSALSAELTDELSDALKPAPLDGKMRKEVDELTGLLKDNLEKVVQHGKRADSIVKNMLLHSREGSGELRPADINALLDESLNLAYHGARAEKPGFNITLQRDFDAGAGTIEVFPQEITRAFLNLISNGFYAATRRKADNGGTNFEPLLLATTKDLGAHVEIRIRDNGSGIPAEVKEKMFNPFFTTKPAGEGTGLGLSMSHDIIVKQHGGRIDVATEPGHFTEFTIVLPRTIRR